LLDDNYLLAMSNATKVKILAAFEKNNTGRTAYFLNSLDGRRYYV